MAEHNLLYILELDGHAKPDDLNAVNFCSIYSQNMHSISFEASLLRCGILPTCIYISDSCFSFL